MPLQTSGSISMSDIVSEYSGASPHSISEYYRGGQYVITGFYVKGSFVQRNTTVPSSGTISFSNFYGQGNSF